MRIKANCPVCKGPLRLEEILLNSTVISEVDAIHEGGMVQYGEQANDGGDVDGYECSSCGAVMRDDDGNIITDTEQLYEIFLKRGWLV